MNGNQRSSSNNDIALLPKISNGVNYIRQTSNGVKMRKGDQVLIISGKDRGKQGKVLDVFPKEERIVVEGANIRKRHLRPKKAGEKGQIVEMTAPVAVSSVKLICTKCGKPTRVGYKIVEDKKYRICKKCGGEI